jgi:hypothetical protein
MEFSRLIGITNRTKLCETKNGYYHENVVDENFGYLVRLFNNEAILMSKEIARDYDALSSSIF